MSALRIPMVLAAFAGVLALGCERSQNPVEPPSLGGILATVVSGAGQEPNDTCLAATDLGAVTLPLTIYDTLSGFPFPGGDVDFFRFAGPPNQQVTVDLEGQSTGQGTLGDPFLGAFDSGCGQIGVDDDGGTGTNSRLALTIPSDGVLVLGVTRCCDGSFNFGGEGTYRLTVDTGVPALPPPVASFYYYPYDPSSFDAVQFYDYSYDPGGWGIASQAWTFGDGASATGCCPTHRYAADGDYQVTLAVTTYDGRSDSTSQVVHVATHDVAITRFAVPRAATAGQTRTLTVGVNSRRAAETVEVVLLKGIPGYGYQYVGTLIQSVPKRSANRTTDFNFSYTFTSSDAQIGKVTFKAIANIVGGRDALPADNEAVASPVKVSR